MHVAIQNYGTVEITATNCNSSLDTAVSLSVPRIRPENPEISYGAQRDVDKGGCPPAPPAPPSPSAESTRFVHKHKTASKVIYPLMDSQAQGGFSLVKLTGGHRRPTSTE